MGISQNPIVLKDRKRKDVSMPIFGKTWTNERNNMQKYTVASKVSLSSFAFKPIP